MNLLDQLLTTYPSVKPLLNKWKDSGNSDISELLKSALEEWVSTNNFTNGVTPQEVIELSDKIVADESTDNPLIQYIRGVGNSLGVISTYNRPINSISIYDILMECRKRYNPNNTPPDLSDVKKKLKESITNLTHLRHLCCDDKDLMTNYISLSTDRYEYYDGINLECSDSFKNKVIHHITYQESLSDDPYEIHYKGRNGSNHDVPIDYIYIVKGIRLPDNSNTLRYEKISGSKYEPVVNLEIECMRIGTISKFLMPRDTINLIDHNLTDQSGNEIPHTSVNHILDKDASSTATEYEASFGSLAQIGVAHSTKESGFGDLGPATYSHKEVGSLSEKNNPQISFDGVAIAYYHCDSHRRGAIPTSKYREEYLRHLSYDTVVPDMSDITPRIITHNHYTIEYNNQYILVKPKNGYQCRIKSFNIIGNPF